MNKTILVLSLILIAVGFFLIIYDSFTLFGMTVYPYFWFGLIIVIIGFVTGFISLAVGTSDSKLQYKVSRTTYLNGLPEYPEKSTGTLLFENKRLKFVSESSSSKMRLDIPVSMVKSVKFLNCTEESSEKSNNSKCLTIDVYSKSYRHLVLNFEFDSSLENEIKGWIKWIYPDAIKVREKENENLNILKTRLAKGEITKEQYEEMKRVLEGKKS